MLITSFYDEAAQRIRSLGLQASAEALGLECRIFDRSGRSGIDGTHGWKAEAFLRTLADYPGKDVLLVDPGPMLLQRPDILLDERDFDLAVHYDLESGTPTGPIFVRNNERIWRALGVWQEAGRARPDQTDLETLPKVLDDPDLGLEIRRLPVTYAWVEAIHRRRHPDASPVLSRFLWDGQKTSPYLVAT